MAVAVAVVAVVVALADIEVCVFLAKWLSRRKHVIVSVWICDSVAQVAKGEKKADVADVVSVNKNSHGQSNSCHGHFHGHVYGFHRPLFRTGKKKYRRMSSKRRDKDRSIDAKPKLENARIFST